MNCKISNYCWLSIIFLLAGCNNHQKPSREAIDLNNEAVKIMTSTGDTAQLKIAAVLLDKAIQIDSNYITAYINKSTVQVALKNYKEALSAFKRFYKMTYNKSQLEYPIGLLYERTGDTISAKKHYSAGLIYKRKILDTISSKNPQYGFVVEEMGDILILLNKRAEVDSLLKVALGTDQSSLPRELLIAEFKKSRKEVLYPELYPTVTDNTNTLEKTSH